MAEFVIDSVPARLAGDTYSLDEEKSHIEVDREFARKLGASPLLERICPMHVYSIEADGMIGVEYAACLECRTYLAMAPKGMLKWHYPRGSFGIIFREDWNGKHKVRP